MLSFKGVMPKKDIPLNPQKRHEASDHDSMNVGGDNEDRLPTPSCQIVNCSASGASFNQQTMDARSRIRDLLLKRVLLTGRKMNSLKSTH